jgi:hypothetical protein
LEECSKGGGKMLKICIGYDPAETVAYHVLCHSIQRQSSGPVAFIPIDKTNIPQFTRGMEDGSTEFSFSRFLTPWLAGYDGLAIFMDSDMLVRGDIYDILDYIDHKHDVYVVKHDYRPKEGKKFLGNTQHIYPKKNWSSMMVFNCYKDGCKKLTPKAVNEESGAWLHRFEWADSVGEIPQEWNHLVGEYTPNDKARIVHFTLGSPCFDGYESQEWAEEWYKEHLLMNASK